MRDANSLACSSLAEMPFIESLPTKCLLCVNSKGLIWTECVSPSNTNSFYIVYVLSIKVIKFIIVIKEGLAVENQ